MPIKLRAIKMEDQDVGGNRYLQLPEIATAALATAAAGNEGGIVYDATTNTVKYSDGSAWATITAGGSAVFAGSPLGTHTHAVTATGTNATSAVTGALNVVTPNVQGTGYATAAQVVTTTENFTADENAYAGMWFMSDVLTSSPAVLIMSHPAAAGAPLALTCNGVPPVTDAGAFRICGMAGTAAGQVFTGNAVTSAATSGGTPAGTVTLA